MEIGGEQEGRILGPVPVVKRQQRINLADQLLEVIDDLAMPGQELRPP